MRTRITIVYIALAVIATAALMAFAYELTLPTKQYVKHTAAAAAKAAVGNQPIVDEVEKLIAQQYGAQGIPVVGFAPHPRVTFAGNRATVRITVYVIDPTSGKHTDVPLTVTLTKGLYQITKIALDTRAS